MSLKDRLLATLPPEVKVFDCAVCGALCTNNDLSWKAYRDYGLRRQIGSKCQPEIGHYRPLCALCSGGFGTSSGPDRHAPGQRAKINRIQGLLDE